MLKKAFLLSLALTLIPYISHAEIKTYTHTVKQSFGGSQSPDDARIAAIHKAKREALEKAGTYLESLTIVKESVVEKDEILALAAGVLKAEVVSQKNYHTKDAFGIIVVAKVDVDTSVLEDRIKKLLQDRELLKRYKEGQKREKDLLAKIARLEDENRGLSTSPVSADTQKKEELKKQFRATAEGLTAVELYNKAVALRKDGQHIDLNQVLDYLNQTIRLDPNFVWAYAHRGFTYYELGQSQRAIEDYSHAIRLDPNFVLAYSGRGFTYFGLGQNQRAIEDYSKTIHLDPNNAHAYFIRGLAYEQLGQFQRAIKDYERGVPPGSNFFEYLSRGQLYYQLGHYQQAFEDLNQAIRIDPKHSNAYYYRGLAYNKLGKPKQAIEDLNQAIRIDPYNAEAYVKRGKLYLHFDQRQQAIEDFNQATRIDPYNAGAYVIRGLTYYQLDQHQRANEDFNQAIRIDPKRAGAYNGLAYTYIKWQQFEKACLNFQKACELGDCAGLSLLSEKGLCQ